MTDPTGSALDAASPRTAVDGAVQIAAKALADADYCCDAEAVVAALARAGWLVDPDRLAALEAVAKAGRGIDDAYLRAALAALDALPAPTTGEPR